MTASETVTAIILMALAVGWGIIVRRHSQRIDGLEKAMAANIRAAVLPLVRPLYQGMETLAAELNAMRKFMLHNASVPETRADVRAPRMPEVDEE